MIREVDVERIVTHCRVEAPMEACGIIAGTIHETDDRVEKTIQIVYQCRNELNSPTEYSIGAEEQLAIFLEIENRQSDLLGFYHSHPHNARPSSIDKARANYPGYSYLIVALQPLCLSSWVLEENGEFTEETVSVL
ncbi:MAG: M67 family metallopeptidase [Candidatus Bathyarchaeota archaeon]|nr:MAG: M67 family metallopeptidase [Candidatus Bathyarchaeota archaeon]